MHTSIQYPVLLSLFFVSAVSNTADKQEFICGQEISPERVSILTYQHSKPATNSYVAFKDTENNDQEAPFIVGRVKRRQRKSTFVKLNNFLSIKIPNRDLYKVYALGTRLEQEEYYMPLSKKDSTKGQLVACKDWHRSLLNYFVAKVKDNGGDEIYISQNWSIPSYRCSLRELVSQADLKKLESR